MFRQARWQYDKEKIEPLIFELSEEGKIGHIIPEVEKEIKDEIGNPEDEIPPNLRRKDLPELPQVTEVEVVRHYTRLSQMNYG
ncbi:aminomethyl-transferring glycine dehydrogenase subunit GcvPB, partial [Thermococci archaeon]